MGFGAWLPPSFLPSDQQAPIKIREGAVPGIVDRIVCQMLEHANARVYQIKQDVPLWENGFISSSTSLADEHQHSEVREVPLK